MSQIKNYAAQASRDLEQFSRMLERRGFIEDWESVGALVAQIKKSVHFSLPDFGRVFDDGLKGLFDMDLHLPFPSVTLEYFVPNDSGVSAQTLHTPKRLVLATEVSNLDDSLAWLPLHLERIVRQALSEPVLNPDGRGILVWGACAIPSPDSPKAPANFSPESCMWLLPSSYPSRDAFDESSATVIGADKRTETKARGKPSRSGPILGQDILALAQMAMHGMRHERVGKAAFDEVRNALSSDIAQEAGVVLEFIEASSCSNVTHEIAQQAPKSSVTAKREREGKVPIYETRVLTIEAPGRFYVAGAGSAQEHGRNGPRQHLRRGHVRRLDNGKRTWVQSAVVGAKSTGVIEKAYAIQKA